MLLRGINHVAVLTGDTERFLEFYGGVFGATHEALRGDDGFRLTIVWVGPTAELNVFELDGNTEHERQVPMFGRGRLDHLALEASSIEAFDEIRERLLARGATDGFVTDFGHILSLFFRDPDGLEAEVCVQNPDARPGVHNPPGTPSLRHHPPGSTPPARVESATEQQFDALAEVSGLLEGAGVDHWVGGGWAVDLHLQRVTRAHSDVDLVVRLGERDQLTAVLEGAGFAPTPSDTPDAVQTFVRDGIAVEVTFIVEAADGTVVTPGFEDWPWIPGAFGAGAVELRGLRLRAVSAEALLDTKVGWAAHVGEDPRPHDLADIEALRNHLGHRPTT